ncbi:MULTISPECIES: ABC transporter ATP-binding protein [Cytobacillus]|uniref:ABC transporter ATP-binding protein n=1 Tax=Cytobacillus TaxID=2675230 RepID=UPI00203C4847|nr:ABC transporter ATP-binding protein [Cytobacillus firmus]MCM3706574.1 ABC transporter ATP-binding protein [Cytobacillus firmus]
MIQLSVNSLSKSFDSIQVLSSLSFHVNKGEFVSVIGPSGSGKSTIFNLIGGMLLPDEGSIMLGEAEISGKRGSISYMPQTPSLMPWRTILQNVLLGQEIMGKTEPETARKMLQKAGLGGYENAFPHELSGGMKQRTAFIRALLSPQPIILLDEPFSALDELTRHDMQKWLLDIWNEHKPTILFVTHNIEEAIYLSDRILILGSKPAKVVQEYTVPFARPRMEEIFLDEKFLECKRSIHHALKELSFKSD